jgi:riboflavin-specific deaminase-like protein
MRRLLPVPTAEIDLRDELWAEDRDGGDRPWVMANMISSLDGTATIDGRSGQLGGPGDRELFHALRGRSDAILVGAGTVRAERYGPPRVDERDVDRRAAIGLSERPVIVIVTASLDLDPELPVFGDPTARPVVITVEKADPARVERLSEMADVVVAGTDRVDGALAVALLASLGSRTILCEGGPTLLGDLHAADLVDEWCVTVSPVTTAGRGVRIAHGDTAVAHRLELDRVWEEEGMLFLRELRPRDRIRP